MATITTTMLATTANATFDYLVIEAHMDTASVDDFVEAYIPRIAEEMQLGVAAVPKKSGSVILEGIAVLEDDGRVSQQHQGMAILL